MLDRSNIPTICDINRLSLLSEISTKNNISASIIILLEVQDETIDRPNIINSGCFTISYVEFADG
jgi:hypothetical protein